MSFHEPTTDDGCASLRIRFQDRHRPGRLSPWWPFYWKLLLSHILLSIIALPLILTTFFLSLTGRFPIHRRLARYTFPIWLYVSVTGVLVYAMLKLFNT